MFPGSQILKIVGFPTFPGSQVIKIAGVRIFPGSQFIKKYGFQYFQVPRSSKWMFFCSIPGSQVIKMDRFSICPGHRNGSLVNMSMFPDHKHVVFAFPGSHVTKMVRFSFDISRIASFQPGSESSKTVKHMTLHSNKTHGAAFKQQDIRGIRVVLF